MLGDIAVQPMIPVKDLKTARKFYEDTLGLKPVHLEPGAHARLRSRRAPRATRIARPSGAKMTTTTSSAPLTANWVAEAEPVDPPWSWVRMPPEASSPATSAPERVPTPPR